jgi:hypothetical protein
LSGFAEKIVPVGALATAHAPAEARLSRIAAALPLDLAYGNTHATRGIHNSVQAGESQEISARDLIALEGHAAGLDAAIGELNEQASLIRLIGCRVPHETQSHKQQERQA